MSGFHRIHTVIPVSTPPHRKKVDGCLTRTTMHRRQSLPERSRFLLFHKPKGYLVTRKDEKERKTVYQALPAFVLQEGWVPIGRLDKDSRGLLLFTREGPLVDLLTQPGRCEKIYEVLIRGRISDQDLSRTVTGISTPIGRLTVQRKSAPKRNWRSS